MSSQPLIGQTLGRHRIRALIGKGGMGTVYQAHDELLQREVAVKVMHAHFARQEEFRARFLQEARTAAQLLHPGIVQVYDIGETGSETEGLLYIIMEYVPGPNLRQMLETLQTRRQQLHLSEALLVVRELAQTLHYAHRRGILHRDIKPANILIRPEPSASLPFQPVFTDLGLAKLLGKGITTPGLTVGTPAYMSPEQALGQTTDARSEVYALGVVLYELCTGTRPFPAETLTDAIRYHTQEPPPPPGRYRADLPPLMADLILKTLAKDPAGRFPTAQALADALRDAAARPHQPSLPAVSLTSCYPGLEKQITDRLDLAAPPPAQDQITIHYPDQTTRIFPITNTPFIIGRGLSDDNSLQLPFDNISRQHASIDYNGHDYLVTDLGSTNGTFLASAQLLPGIPEPWPSHTPLFVGQCRLLLALAEKTSTTQLLGKPAPPAGPPPAGHEATGEVVILLPPQPLTILPGRVLTLPITILNQSRLVDHFSLSVDGLPTAWITPPPETHLFPGDRAEVSLALHPPPVVDSRAGSYPITITVRSRAEQRIVGQTTANLLVEPFYQWQASLQPQRQRSAAQGHYTLQLINQGNADLPLLLSASDPEGVCRFHFAPAGAAASAPTADITIPASESRQVPLIVRHQSDAPATQEHSYQFTIQTRPGVLADQGLGPRQLNGEWIHTPPDFQITLEPAQQRSLGQGHFLVTITNPARAGSRGDQDNAINLRLHARDPQAGCTYQFTPAELTIPAGQSATSQLAITPHLPLPDGHEQAYPFTLTASLLDNPAVAQQANGTWVQLAPHFHLELTAGRPEGSTFGLYTVQLHNDSRTEFSLKLAGSDGVGSDGVGSDGVGSDGAGSDEAGSCRFAFDSDEVTVPAGKTQAVQLIVRRAGDELVPAGRDFPFTITARPTLVPQVSQQIAGQWRQLPPRFDLSLLPHGTPGLRQTQYRVRFTNPEPVDLTVTLQAGDPAGAGQYQFSATQLRLPAGQTTETQLTVQARRPLPGTQAITHHFAVRARLAALPAVAREAPGQWEQRPPSFSIRLRADAERGVNRGLYVIELRNGENDPLTIDLVARDESPVPACTFRLAASQVTIAGGQMRKLQMKVSRHDGTLTAATRIHPFTVIARASDAPQLLRQATEQWAQTPPTFDVRLVAAPQLDRQQGVFQVEVTNTSSIELPIGLTAHDTTRACRYELSATQLLIPAGESQRATLTVRPQQMLLGTQGQTHRFTVDARLTILPEVSQQAQGSWLQIPSAFNLRLAPNTRRSRGSARYQLLAQNESDVPLTLQARATDPAGALRFEFSPPELFIPAGQSRLLRLKTRPVQPLAHNDPPHKHPFQVQAGVTEIPQFTEHLAGEWEELPRRRFLNCGCLVALFILLLIIAIFVVIVLQS